MSENNDVVITGLGVVSPIGIGVEAFWDALLQGKSGIAHLVEHNVSGFSANFGGEIKDFEPKKYVKPRKSLKVMCREIQTGFSAAAMAMEQAGLAPGDVDPERLGVVYGSEMFFTDFRDMRSCYEQCIEFGIFQHNKWGTSLSKGVNPLWMLNYLPNMPACHVGIYFDGRGHNNSVCSVNVSSIEALAEGVSHIQRGRCDVMIIGGTSNTLSISGLLYRGDKYLSKQSDNPETACRPFDAHRSGKVNAEGAGAIVIESRQYAEARGAKILAKFSGYSATYGKAEDESLVDPDAISRGINNALEMADCQANDVSHVSAEGTGLPKNDAVEAAAIRESLGDVPVTALKSYYGDTGAGCGALEIVAAVQSIIHDQVPQTLNYETPDPACPVNVIHGAPLNAVQQNVLTINQNQRGQTAALLLSKP